MPRHFAFLRAINVGGHTVTMARLGEVLTRLGLTDVETFIASGNVAFRSRAPAGARLEGKIAKGLEAALGFPVATFLRTEQELAAIAGRRPFSEAETRRAAAVLVGFIQTPPDRAGIAAVMALRTPIDELQVHGREIYWLCRTRQSESTITGASFERALGAPATFRNVNTVTRLAAKYGIRPA